MKTILLATAAPPLFAAPAFAQDAIGSVGVTYSNPSIEVAGDDVDADVWTVDGSVALPAQDWTVTLNGAIDYTKAFGEEDVTGAAAAHLTKMWSSDVRAGAFVAAALALVAVVGAGCSLPGASAPPSPDPAPPPTATSTPTPSATAASKAPDLTVPGAATQLVADLLDAAGATRAVMVTVTEDAASVAVLRGGQPHTRGRRH